MNGYVVAFDDSRGSGCCWSDWNASHLLVYQAKGLLKNLEQITEIKHALIELRRVGWSERAIKRFS